MAKSKNKILFWLPRILSIILALFIAILSLDVFGGSQPIIQQLIGFLIHNIPSLFLLILIIFSWKNSKTGAIGFLVLGIIFTLFFHTYKNIQSFLILSLPLFIISGLFAMELKKSHK